MTAEVWVKVLAALIPICLFIVSTLPKVVAAKWTVYGCFHLIRMQIANQPAAA